MSILRFLIAGIVAISFGLGTFAQDASFAWAKQLKRGSGLYYETYVVGADDQQNVYIAGSFSNTIDLDPGPLEFNVSANRLDVYICKLDPAGNFVWGKTFNGTGSTALRSISIDPGGNVFTTGFLYGTVDFDPGPAVHNLSAYYTTISTQPDVFISKLDTDGNFQWAHRFGGEQSLDMSHSITVDIFGNVFLTGMISEAVDFDPGSGVSVLGGSGAQDAFITKFDNAGNFKWAKVFSGSGVIQGNFVRTDFQGNVYTTGEFWGTADFDPGPNVYNLTVPNYSPILYLSKLDSSGNFVWAKSRAGSLDGMDVDSAGNIFTFHFYVSKYNTDGDLEWSKDIGARSRVDLVSSRIALDKTGNIYVSGGFKGTIDFDPGSGVFNVTSLNDFSRDVFVCRLDGNGNLIWVKSFGGYSDDYAVGIAVDISGNVYTTGIYHYSGDFDPGPGVFTMSSPTAVTFIHKLSRCLNFTSSILNVEACTSYSVNNTTYTHSGTFTQLLANSAGCDSTITINLTLTSTNTTFTATACDSFNWNNRILITSGIYRDTLVSIGGCDSIINLNLTILNTSASTVSATICEGNSYEGYLSSGTYIDRFVNSAGCDSIRMLTLTVNPKKYSSISNVICEGDSFLGYNRSGIFRDTLIAANGCDSIRTLYLTITPRKDSLVEMEICQGQYFLGYNTTGIYIDTFAGSNGCDSVRTLRLTVRIHPIISESKIICRGENYLGHYLPGRYYDTLSTVSGCDSILITDITVLDIPSPQLGENTIICEGTSLTLQPGEFDSYLWQDGSSHDHIIVRKPGIYWVTVGNKCGSTTDQITVSSRSCIAYFPSAFTPNGDGKNDLFKILYAPPLESFSLKIYNRYGQMIFETNNQMTGWDGTYRGSPLATETFVWHCSFTEAGKISLRKGTVTLIR